MAASVSAKKPAAWQQAVSEGGGGNNVRCVLCPNNCLVAPGKCGICRARKNENGRLVSLVYGRPCSTHTDPIEKKPLLHFLPNSSAFSLGTLGCNLRCQHCQNYSISQPTDIESSGVAFVPPEAIVEAAVRSGSKSIAYTYNEPTIFYEYVLDIAKLARARGLKNVMVTNGYINQEPLDELYPYIDAANVDLKAFTEDFYHNICGARLSSVCSTLERLRTKHPHVWIEIAYLVIPHHNDSPQEVESAAEWIANTLGNHTPLHLSRFFPKYKMKSVEITPERTLTNAVAAAKKHLQYVYVGNIATADGERTYCHSCRAPLIDRQGYSVDLMRDWTPTGQCGRCGTKIPGVWSL
ncbi:AmmeMemoRadiSam system radical SAM enzyme [Pelomyxa schiedti]|nr:AmmeMemoRadiSam system radical SAM enzyme [Pelomyxa schiedti]